MSDFTERARARLDAFLADFDEEEQERLIWYALDHVVPRMKSLASAPGEAPSTHPTDAELEKRTGEPHIDGWPLMSGLPRPREAVAVLPPMHAATVDLVARFAGALHEKLAAAEKKYGYSDGWTRPDWMDECRTKLLEHVAKGDPRDVAAYCAFLWHHGASTAASREAREAPAVPDRDAAIRLWRKHAAPFRSSGMEHPESFAIDAMQEFAASALTSAREAREAPTCVECGGPLQWRCPACKIAQSREVAREAPEPKVIYSPIETSPHAVSHGLHPNDNEPHDPDRARYLDERGDDRGQGLSTYWKWGHAAGWNDHKRHVAAALSAARQEGREEAASVAGLYAFRIPGQPRATGRGTLDPILVVVRNESPGRGQLVVECSGEAWSAWWGAMSGRTVEQFVAACDADYLAGCLERGSRDGGDYLRDIVEAVRAAIRALPRQ